MWRLACSSVRRRVLSRCSSGGRSNLAAGSLTWFSRAASAVDTDDWKHTAHHAFIKSTPIRHFSRRPKDHLDDPQEEMLEERESQAKKENEGSVAAVWNMEFFDEQLINANSDDAGYNDGDDDEEELAARMDEEYRQKQEEIQRELDSREGRPWKDPWAIKEEQWMSTTGFDDLPDWSSDRVSRISQERVQVLPDGIPTLSTLASIALPDPASPHPGHGQAKAYAKYRKQEHYQFVAEKVKVIAKDRVEAIAKMTDWNAKQDSVDELFETIIDEMKAKEEILGKHPDFAAWVERGLEEYLRTVNKSGGVVHGGADGDKSNEASTQAVQPVFMDLYNADDGEKVAVPSILNPLQPHRHDGPGRMVEEWEIAANKKTKRIMIRDATKSIAKILEEHDSSRIFVHGRRGVGKTAVLASIVASARRSGHIVLYLPDGDRLRKNGYFVTPNAQREGMFDLQNLSQEACEQLLANHADDLVGMEADKATMEYYFKDTQLKRIPDYTGDTLSLLTLLNYAKERKNHAPMSYSVVVDRLMNQVEKPFLMVMDEFNCYYDHGHYFHMAYDEDVREAIPYKNINLFEHAMAAMTLSADDDGDEITQSPKLMKRGAIIVATTESHAVRRKISDSLIESAQSQAEDGDMHVVEVPRFSNVEVEHILANFECIGLGKLRLDRGDTVMNEQEVAYLKMASGSVGQKLLDVSVM